MAYKWDSQGALVRLEDGAIIPVAEDNRDYARYLRWVAEGNEAEPAEDIVQVNPKPTIESLQAQLESIMAQLKEIQGT